MEEEEWHVTVYVAGRDLRAEWIRCGWQVGTMPNEGILANAVARSDGTERLPSDRYVDLGMLGMVTDRAKARHRYKRVLVALVIAGPNFAKQTETNRNV